MMKQWHVLLISSFLAISVVYSAEDTPYGDWDYSGNKGPQHWAELDPEYAPCNGGKNQSPINIAGAAETQLHPLSFHYTNEPNEILNNGHTIKVTFPPGSTLTVNDHTFELKHVHFHAPSEHHLEGKAFPMEGHLVHADADGSLAVVSVFYEYEEEKPNPIIAKLWKTMPWQEGEHHPLMAHISAIDLLPQDKDYYLYNGSLTTPPCSEGVWWVLLEQPVPISEEQVHVFTSVIHHFNNRPEQPINARVPLHSH